MLISLTTSTKSCKKGKLKKIDVRVLEGLALYSPRNKSKISEKIGIPLGTLRYRIGYLRSNFSLLMPGNIYHTNIGLRKAVVFAESKPGYEDVLYQCLKANDFWLYMSQCIGSSKVLAVYGIPAGKEGMFQEFLDIAKQEGPASGIEYSWSTSFQSVNATKAWYNQTSEEWTFPWGSWLEEIYNAKTDLPYTLNDPDAYLQKADWADIIILKEMEKDCTIRLKALSKILGITLQGVRYHFENHIMKGRLFEGQQILAEHFKGLSPETYYFRFKFKGHPNFAKFAYSLMNKPFVRAEGKVCGSNELFAQIYLPRAEIRNFLDIASKLVKEGFMETYDYVIQDLTRTERQTISYECLKEKQWEYDHAKFLDKLRSIAASLPKAAA